MRTPIERETALIFAAAMLMQDVVHNKALDRPARDKIREAALTLKEMADEIEEGRIVVLPCKVGDTVYRIVNDAEPHITKDLVCEIRVSAGVTLVISLIGDRIICEDDFGKIVFLSYQEAEAALKGEDEK